MGLVSNSGYAQFMRKPKQPPATRRGGDTLRRRQRAPARKPRVYPNRIKGVIDEKGMTYALVADALDPPAHEITIAKLATGKQRLTQDWMNRLALVLGVAPQDFIAKPSEPHLRHVHVRGALKAGDWSENHEWAADDQFDVMIPDHIDLRALQLYGAVISGESMNLRYQAGSVVVLSRIAQRPGEIVIGKRYHVRRTRADGLVEETIKTLVKDELGRFWLKPESTHPEHQEWISLDGKAGETVDLIGRVRFVVGREE